MLETEQRRLTEHALALYERYGRPLEQDHAGEYLMIAQDGRTLLAPTLVQATIEGAAMLGRGNFVFKIGGPEVASWKTPR